MNPDAPFSLVFDHFYLLSPFFILYFCWRLAWWRQNSLFNVFFKQILTHPGLRSRSFFFVQRQSNLISGHVHVHNEGIYHSIIARDREGQWVRDGEDRLLFSLACHQSSSAFCLLSVSTKAHFKDAISDPKLNEGHGKTYTLSLLHFYI